MRNQTETVGDKPTCPVCTHRIPVPFLKPVAVHMKSGAYEGSSQFWIAPCPVCSKHLRGRVDYRPEKEVRWVTETRPIQPEDLLLEDTDEKDLEDVR